VAMNAGRNKENLEWINSLRVLATFSVIFLHVTAGILYQYGSISNLDWWTGNIYDSSVRFCVPIFLMISGALILSKTYESTREYLKKRVLRILFPFLFWSIIYIARDLFLKFNYGEYLSFIEILKFIFIKLKSGASFHLWYIYLIIGLYLFFPIIGKWIHNSNKHEIKYFLGIWSLTVFAHLPFVKNFIPNIEISYFSGYIGLPVLGYYLSKTTFNFNEKKAVYILSVLTGVLITIFGTYFATKQRGSFYSEFYDYLTPNVILVSIGIFLLFKDFVKFNSKIILFFSKYSYGTYLIHILVLWILEKLGFSYAFVNPIIGISITSVLCFIVSTLIVFVINKLPLGKYISG
jgi:surface polysaccharide O-acyltransferase-like enzyme